MSWLAKKWTIWFLKLSFTLIALVLPWILLCILGSRLTSFSEMILILKSVKFTSKIRTITCPGLYIRKNWTTLAPLWKSIWGKIFWRASPVSWSRRSSWRRTSPRSARTTPTPTTAATTSATKNISGRRYPLSSVPASPLFGLLLAIEMPLKRPFSLLRRRSCMKRCVALAKAMTLPLATCLVRPPGATNQASSLR